jgi:hypothetical protein
MLLRCRGQLKCDGTRIETEFRLSAKRTSPFKSAVGASVQSTAGSRGVRISGSNAGYTMFRGSVKGTGYSLHSPVCPSLPLPCVTVCHHSSTGVYKHLHVTYCMHLITFAHIVGQLIHSYCCFNVHFKVEAVCVFETSGYDATSYPRTNPQSTSIVH